MCLDFPLCCNHIEFFVPPTQPLAGPIVSAGRRSISRGMSFEAEEREIAFRKTQSDYDFFFNASLDLRVASRHYINGLTLLGLEDSYPGLIDAAFMQFYQACEILCGNNHKRREAQQHVATLSLKDQDTTQIVLHHVWNIRNDYFGHGNTNNGLYACESSEAVFKIAKQVLVVRWLCRTLLDCACPSAQTLCREIGLYHKGSSDSFHGTVQELETSFRGDYEHERRVVKILNRFGKVEKEYVLK